MFCLVNLHQTLLGQNLTTDEKIKAGQSDINPQPTLTCISAASAWLHAFKTKIQTTAITFTESLFFNVTIVP